MRHPSKAIEFRPAGSVIQITGGRQLVGRGQEVFSFLAALRYPPENSQFLSA